MLYTLTLMPGKPPNHPASSLRKSVVILPPGLTTAYQAHYMPGYAYSSSFMASASIGDIDMAKVALSKSV